MKKIASFITGVVVASPVANLNAVVVNSTYVGPTGGNWNLAANWSPVGVPNNGANTFNVFVDGTAALRGVNLNVDTTISELTVNAGDFLTVNNGVQLSVLGPIVNDATITLNSAGGNTYLRPANGVLTLNGSGTLVFSDSANNWMYRVGAGTGLLNGPNHTIRGAGNLGWSAAVTSITNQGTIIGQGVNPLIADATAGLTNTGLMLADAGTLRLFNGVVTNVGGTIRAADNSVVQISSNATVAGGTLETLGSGVILANTGSSRVDGSVNPITLDGLLRVANGSDLFAVGTITNNDTIELSSTGAATYIRVNNGPLVLDGPGELVLSDQSINWIYRSGTGSTLLNGADHTIRGAGNLGWSASAMAITNNGQIIAQGVNPLIADATAGFTNNGLMLADAGTLRLFNGIFSNVGGTIRAGDNSVVEISSNAIVDGGALETLGSGVILANTGSSRINGSINPVTLDGLLRVTNAAEFYAVGTIHNNDTIEMASTGGPTYLRINNGLLTLDGPGEMVLSDQSSNWIYRSGATGSLINGPNHTIRGAGNLGWSASATAITNEGAVLAQGVNALVADLTGGFTNNGLMRADAGTLRLVNGILNNAAGTVEAADGFTVEIGSNATIAGGAVKTYGSGVILANTGNSRIDGSANPITLDGLLRVGNGAELYAAGTIQNNDTIAMASGVTATYMKINGPLTLSGAGEMVLADTPNNWIYRSGATGTLLNGPNHTIRGAGNLGWSASATAITNQGTIIADGVNPLLIDCTHTNGFVNTGLLHVTGAGGSLLGGANFTNQGQVVIDATRTLTRNNANYSQSSGTTTVNGTLTLPAALNVQLAGGVLNGNGTVAKLVNNTGGSVEPGTSAGQLNLGAGFTQASGGTLAIEIGGGTAVTQHDLLAVTGNVNLGGVLNVSLINGFTPAPGQKFTFLTHTGTRVGSFCSIQPKGTWDVVYTPNSVQLVSLGTGCPNDVNGDGVVNVVDLLAVVGAWGTCPNTCPTCHGDVAPIVGNGVVNVQDLLAVVGAWGACP